MPASSASNDAPSWRRFLDLPVKDKWRLAVLAALLPVIDMRLRRQGLRATQAWLARWQGKRRPRPCTPLDLADAERVAQLANIAGRRGFYANTCLRQALAVHWWLRRRGLPAQLSIGAQAVGATLDAHAWVELDGVPLAQDRELPPTFDSLTGEH